MRLRAGERDKNMLPYIPGWNLDEWDFVNHLNQLLEPTIKAIKLLEGDTYPTQSYMIITMCVIKKRVESMLAQQQGNLFRAVLNGFKKELDEVFISLPVETYLATALDPRFKTLSCIPEEKHEQIFTHLFMEYSTLRDTIPVSKNVPTPTNSVSPFSITPSKEQPTKTEKRKLEMYDLFDQDMQQNMKKVAQEKNTDELKAYKELPIPDLRSDPLEWWRRHESVFPALSRLARIYLSIPASQATTERSFSTANIICSDLRTSLSPENLEILTMLKKNNHLLAECEDNSEIINDDENLAEHPQISPEEEMEEEEMEEEEEKGLNAAIVVEREDDHIIVEIPKVSPNLNAPFQRMPSKSPNAIVRENNQQAFFQPAYNMSYPNFNSYPNFQFKY
jgi:hypothetical protein